MMLREVLRGVLEAHTSDRLASLESGFLYSPLHTGFSGTFHHPYTRHRWAMSCSSLCAQGRFQGLKAASPKIRQELAGARALLERGHCP